MSAYLLGTGFRCDMGTPCRKLILLKLIDACEDDGTRIFPAVATIARAAQCSTRQVQRELALMVQVGLLSVVREGGKGPKSTREYRMDIRALRAIEERGWTEVTGAAAAFDADACEADDSDNKGDTVSPLADRPDAKGDTGDTLRVTPATDKGDKLSHPTPPYPSIDPSEREARERESAGSWEGKSEAASEPIADRAADRPGTAEFEKRVLHFCNGRGYTAGPWKDWDTASPGWAAGQFGKLSIDERAEAERWRDAYLADMAARKRRPVPVGVFLRDRLWTGLDPAVLERHEQLAKAAAGKPDRATEPPFGKGWGAARLSALIAPPAPLPKPTSYQQTVLDQGGRQAAALEAERLAKFGWPIVSEMHRLAEERRGYTVETRLADLGAGFVQVKRDSALWDAWRLAHEARGWPWLPNGPEWVWMPAGAPDQAIADFEAMVRARDGSDGSAGGDEAA